MDFSDFSQLFPQTSVSHPAILSIFSWEGEESGRLRDFNAGSRPFTATTWRMLGRSNVSSGTRAARLSYPSGHINSHNLRTPISVRLNPRFNCVIFIASTTQQGPLELVRASIANCLGSSTQAVNSSPTTISTIATMGSLGTYFLDVVYSFTNCMVCFPSSPQLKINSRSFKILRLLGEVSRPSLIPMNES